MIKPIQANPVQPDIHFGQKAKGDAIERVLDNLYQVGISESEVNTDYIELTKVVEDNRDTSLKKRLDIAKMTLGIGRFEKHVIGQCVRQNWGKYFVQFIPFPSEDAKPQSPQEYEQWEQLFTNVLLEQGELIDNDFEVSMLNIGGNLFNLFSFQRMTDEGILVLNRLLPAHISFNPAKPQL